jgi:hypothetical protein
MSKTARNEKMKLKASWYNSVSAAVISVGMLGPAITKVIGTFASQSGFGGASFGDLSYNQWPSAFGWTKCDQGLGRLNVFDFYAFLAPFLGIIVMMVVGRFATGRAPSQSAPSFRMNHSIYSADRSTHLKIVIVAVVAGFAVAGFGISARVDGPYYTQTMRVIKQGLGVLLTDRGKEPQG